MRIHPTVPLVTFFALLFAAPAWAGPPLICHSIPIGSQRSLPWLDTGSWNGTDPSYDLNRLVRDTLGLLAPGAPATLRMETMRRAAIYSARTTGLGNAILLALEARIVNAKAGNNVDPAAWFDAGYFAQTLRQAAKIYPQLQAPDVDGIAWMRTAVRLGFNDYGAISTIKPE